MKIGRKVSEAKSTKSFDTFQILAQYITEKCLLDILLPIKEVLNVSHSYKIVRKAEECLRFIAMGLIENQFIGMQSMLKFAYGTASQSICQITIGNEKPMLPEKEQEKMARQKEDCFIILKAPMSRFSARQSSVKVSDKTNAHLLIQFGLKLLYFLMKKDKLRDNSYLPFIAPFVPIFKSCLSSQQVKVSIYFKYIPVNWMVSFIKLTIGISQTVRDTKSLKLPNSSAIVKTLQIHINI